MKEAVGLERTFSFLKEAVLEGVSVLLVFLFFFSSRRRHTRFDCDWSSDVCSSDLSCTVSSVCSGTRGFCRRVPVRLPAREPGHPMADVQSVPRRPRLPAHR